MARKIMPMVRPFLWLCTEKWNSMRSLERILPSTHFLLLSGLRDDLVPPEQMKQLWKAVTQNGTKRRVWHDFPQGTHSMCLRLLALIDLTWRHSDDTCVQPDYWNKIKEFIESI